MDYCKSIQATIDEIEAHLKDEINCDTIISKSFYSKTHFYRIFAGIVGMSLHEYLRKRRLSSAAVQICTTKKRIIDIAVDFEFASQEVFTRAFFREFGITPGRFRKDQSNVVLLEKINVINNFYANVNQLRNYETQVVVSKEFFVMGMQRTVKPGSNIIKKLWDEFMGQRAMIPVLNSNVIMGLCEYAPDIKENDNFSYIFCMEADNLNLIPEGMVVKKIPSSKYAKIIHDESQRTLKDTYQIFYGLWLPNSGLELAQQDTIEVYYLNENKMEIWIPVISN